MNWSRHTIVPRSHRVIPGVYWQEDKECNFYTYVALRSLSYPNSTKLAAEMLPQLGESTYQTWTKLRQPIPRYERAKFRNNIFVFFFVFSHTLHFRTSLANAYSYQAETWHTSRANKAHLGTNSDQDLRSYDQFFVQKKVEGLSRLQGKPLDGIGWNLACRWSNYHTSAFLKGIWKNTTEIWHKTQPASKLRVRICE